MGNFLTLSDLQSQRRTNAVLSVFGDPVAHSLSPQLHNPALQALGIPGEYVRIEVKEAEFPAALKRIHELGYYGTNVTIPHKFTALRSVDIVSEQARRLGVVNTIIFENGRAMGRNSDGPGFVRAVEEGFAAAVKDLRVLIIGAGGGAGRAVAVQCALENCQELVLMNRSMEKVHALQQELAEFFPPDRIRVEPWTQERIAATLGSVDLVINGTNLGMQAEDADVLAGATLERHHLAYDMVYKPLETAFLLQAKAAGAKYINGLPMLLHQGVVSFEWWFNRPAPLAAMRAGLYGAIQQTLS
jgi:shikimate dehydrogenase